MLTDGGLPRFRVCCCFYYTGSEVGADNRWANTLRKLQSPAPRQVAGLFLCRIIYFVYSMKYLSGKCGCSELHVVAVYVFGVALILLIISLALLIKEIQISVKALEHHISDIENS